MTRRRRLERLHSRLQRVREQVEVAAAQAAAMRDEAEDMRIRALSSDRPDDRAEATAADRHARTAEDTRDRLRAEAEQLARDIDAELDRGFPS